MRARQNPIAHLGLERVSLIKVSQASRLPCAQNPNSEKFEARNPLAHLGERGMGVRGSNLNPTKVSQASRLPCKQNPIIRTSPAKQKPAPILPARLCGEVAEPTRSRRGASPKPTQTLETNTKGAPLCN